MGVDGYKTYLISALMLVSVVVEGLINGNWNEELTAIALLAATLRHAIEKK